MAGCFGDGHISRYDRVKDNVPEELTDLIVDFVREFERVVVHRQKDATEFESTWLLLHDITDHPNHLGEAFHCEILALNGHDHFGGA